MFGELLFAQSLIGGGGGDSGIVSGYEIVSIDGDVHSNIAYRSNVYSTISLEGDVYTTMTLYSVIWKKL